MSTRVSLARQGDVAFLHLDSPDGLHVLSTAVLREMRAHLAALREAPDLLAAVLTGRGHRAFSAGADLRELAELEPASALTFSALGQGVGEALAALPVPVIAVLNGAAYGGGVELAVACDLRLATSEARLQYQAARLGLLPGWGGTQRLPGLVGPGRARRLMLGCEQLDAATALAWGLVDGVAPATELSALLAARLADLRQADPRALRETKRALRGALPTTFALEREAFAACFEGGTTQARIRAWLERTRAASPAASPSVAASPDGPTSVPGPAAGA
ncbi:MAG: enoyl-CoA hydratase/isomerase family protein [Candidatus Sericytochromatia bacterium]|nr:enoyl-CoA hydratase/isomerase family protein [Candidatus Sericytochromatia bacterium]